MLFSVTSKAAGSAFAHWNEIQASVSQDVLREIAAYFYSFINVNAQQLQQLAQIVDDGAVECGGVQPGAAVDEDGVCCHCDALGALRFARRAGHADAR